MVSKFKGVIGIGSGPALPPMHKEPEGMISGEMILCFVLLYMYNNNLLLHWAGIMIMYSKR